MRPLYLLARWLLAAALAILPMYHPTVLSWLRPFYSTAVAGELTDNLGLTLMDFGELRWDQSYNASMNLIDDYMCRKDQSCTITGNWVGVTTNPVGVIYPSNVIADDGIDDRSGIQDAIDNIPVGGRGTILLPCGTIDIKSSASCNSVAGTGICIVDKRVNLWGCGGGSFEVAATEPSATVIKATSSVTGPIIYHTKTGGTLYGRYSTFKDFAIEGTSVAGNGQHGMWLDVRGSNVRDVQVVGVGGHGFYLTDIVAGVFVRTTVQDAGLDCFHFEDTDGSGNDGVTATTLINAEALLCSGDGFNINKNVWGISCFGCISEQNTGYGISFDGAGGTSTAGYSTFVAHWDEGNTEGSVDFDNNSVANYVNFARNSSGLPNRQVANAHNYVDGTMLFSLCDSDVDIATVCVDDSDCGGTGSCVNQSTHPRVAVSERLHAQNLDSTIRVEANTPMYDGSFQADTFFSSRGIGPSNPGVAPVDLGVNETRISQSGSYNCINAPSCVVARNSAGSGDLVLIGANSSDQVVLGTDKVSLWDAGDITYIQLRDNTGASARTRFEFLTKAGVADLRVEYEEGCCATIRTLSGITITMSPNGINAVQFETDGDSRFFKDVLSDGAVQSGASGVSNGEFRLFTNVGYKVSMLPDVAMGADVTYTLPADDGNADEFLQTDGTGSLSWAKPHLSGFNTLDFGSAADGDCSTDLTITVTGASLEDPVMVGAPNASVASGSTFFGWVSAADTVTVRHCCHVAGGCDPASGTFRVTVLR